MSQANGRGNKPNPGSTSDPIALYLDEIGNDDLLTAEEEVKLAKQIEAGQTAIERLRNDKLTELERPEMLRLKAQGEAARAQFIRANTRLVISIAKKYNGHGLHLLDLIQEGNIGLIKAVDEFDYRMGNRFSTYATYWIRQSVMRALDNKSRVIRLPAHIGTRLGKLYHEIRLLTQDNGRTPTIEEIAIRTRKTPEEVSKLLQYGRSPLSLHSPINRESDSELGEFISDENADKPIEIAAKNMLVDEVADVLNNLPPREAKILKLRYGLGDGRPRTLKAIGNVLGVSRERVRQIERRALRRLRSARYGARRLLQYLKV